MSILSGKLVGCLFEHKKFGDHIAGTGKVHPDKEELGLFLLQL